jgi:SPP1 gp7 family putative phage head morphogenesis protein
MSTAADPSRTKTLRKEFGQRLRGVFARINSQAREDIVQKDKLGIRNSLVANRPPNPVHDLSFETDDRKVEAFRNWLRDQERRGRVDVFTRNDNSYIRSAYGRGVKHADAKLREQGAELPERDIQEAFNRPIHQEQLQTLYTRTFTEWEGVAEATNQQISRELADGLAQGENPTKIARRISDRVDKIGKTRATTLARTEVIRSHADATLNRYEELGVEKVAGEAEFQTAGDSRVCPICAGLNGDVYTLKDARGLIPVHSLCRCAWLPVVGDTKQLTLGANARQKAGTAA